MEQSKLLVRLEENIDLRRQAENERLAKQVSKRDNLLNNARKSLGQGLVQVGQHLLNER